MAFAEMLEAASPASANSIICTTTAEGAPYANVAEMAARSRRPREATGIGLTLLPVFYAHAGFGGAAPKPSQRRFLHDVDGFAASARRKPRGGGAGLGDAVVGVAPHSLRAVTEDELTRVTCAGGQARPSTSTSPSRRARSTIASRGRGARPVEWLLDHAPRRCALVPGARHPHDGRGNRGALAKSGAVAGLCPITEANLGDGPFPRPRSYSAGGRFGIGSDSNVLIDAAEELRTLEYGQRLMRRERNVMAARRGRLDRRLRSIARRFAAAPRRWAPAAHSPNAPRPIWSSLEHRSSRAGRAQRRRPARRLDLRGARRRGRLRLAARAQGRDRRAPSRAPRHRPPLQDGTRQSDGVTGRATPRGSGGLPSGVGLTIWWPTTDRWLSG